jgi:hypothetical protein
MSKSLARPSALERIARRLGYDKEFKARAANSEPAVQEIVRATVNDYTSDPAYQGDGLLMSPKVSGATLRAFFQAGGVFMNKVQVDGSQKQPPVRVSDSMIQFAAEAASEMDFRFQLDRIRAAQEGGVKFQSSLRHAEFHPRADDIHVAAGFPSRAESLELVMVRRLCAQSEFSY